MFGSATTRPGVEFRAKRLAGRARRVEPPLAVRDTSRRDSGTIGQPSGHPSFEAGRFGDADRSAVPMPPPSALPERRRQSAGSLMAHGRPVSHRTVGVNPVSRSSHLTQVAGPSIALPPRSATVSKMRKSERLGGRDETSGVLKRHERGDKISAQVRTGAALESQSKEFRRDRYSSPISSRFTSSSSSDAELR